MGEHRTIVTRRDFLRGAACASVAASLGMRAEAQGVRKTRVVLIRNADATASGQQLNALVVQRMLDDAVCALLGVTDPVEAWKRLVKPTDVVGIKTNVWGKLRTPVPVEEAIQRRLVAAGVQPRSIGVDDRGVLSNPLFINSTALINVRPLRAHNWAGVGGCIKNYIMFVPKPSDYHGDSCADLAKIWNEPIVKGKTRLNILLLLTPQFNCLGPHHFDPKFVWPYNGLLVGTDPVALDATGLRLFEAKRRAFFEDDQPLKPPARHIAFADTRHHLGIADPREIELVKLGWTDGALI